MTIKDIIEKLEGDLEIDNVKYPNYRSFLYLIFASQRISYIKKLLKWIKSNLEEGYEEHGKDYDDWKESKIAEEREG